MRTIATIYISGKHWFYITWKYCRGTVNLAAKMCQTCNPFSRAKIRNSNYTIGNFILNLFFFVSGRTSFIACKTSTAWAKRQTAEQSFSFSSLKVRISRYCGLLSKWEFFSSQWKLPSLPHHPSSYEGRREGEGSSHFDEKLSFWKDTTVAISAN